VKRRAVTRGLAWLGTAGRGKARLGGERLGKAWRPSCGETQGGRYIVFSSSVSSSPRNEFGACTPSLSQSWFALTT
jgi:hypothetical protein